MPSWNDILIKLQSGDVGFDELRKQYLNSIHQNTGRNVIAYYSGFIQRAEMLGAQGSVNDDDKNGFMNAVHSLDRTKGLDLILHTPGGDICAAESIVFYLRQMFDDDIRVIIPQMAMSAGTMIACSAKEIIMGKQSSLGPFDPQLSGVPAYGVLKEFEQASKEISIDPAKIHVWREIISKYPPAFITSCAKAIELASEIVTAWLVEVMFKDDPDSARKSETVVDFFNDFDDRKVHSRHLHYTDAQRVGLKVSLLEDNQELQDHVLSLHHVYMLTFSNTQYQKIVENQIGAIVVYT